MSNLCELLKVGLGRRRDISRTGKWLTSQYLTHHGRPAAGGGSHAPPVFRWIRRRARPSGGERSTVRPRL